MKEERAGGAAAVVRCWEGELLSFGTRRWRVGGDGVGMEWMGRRGDGAEASERGEGKFSHCRESDMQLTRWVAREVFVLTCWC